MDRVIRDGRVAEAEIIRVAFDNLLVIRDPRTVRRQKRLAEENNNAKT